eukprot:3096068-Rhodomonas_salina.1
MLIWCRCLNHITVPAPKNVATRTWYNGPVCVSTGPRRVPRTKLFRSVPDTVGVRRAIPRGRQPRPSCFAHSSPSRAHSLPPPPAHAAHPPPRSVPLP